MPVRHQHRGNKKKANVGEDRAKDNSASNSDNKGALLQHKNAGISKSDEEDLRIITAALKTLAGERRGNELHHWSEKLRWRLVETEAALTSERMTHAKTRQKLKGLIVAKEVGLSPKDVSHSPVIEVGGERDTTINSSAEAPMTEFREVKSTADDLRVCLL